jgi:hypothetical protein
MTESLELLLNMKGIDEMMQDGLFKSHDIVSKHRGFNEDCL